MAYHVVGKRLRGHASCDYGGRVLDGIGLDWGRACMQARACS
jgi:hypothetical protein